MKILNSFFWLYSSFAAIFLVACGAKGDNGTYVFEPTTDEARERLPSELAYIISDDYKFKVSIIIKDKEGVMKVQIKSKCSKIPINPMILRLTKNTKYL